MGFLQFVSIFNIKQAFKRLSYNKEKFLKSGGQLRFRMHQIISSQTDPSRSKKNQNQLDKFCLRINFDYICTISVMRENETVLFLGEIRFSNYELVRLDQDAFDKICNLNSTIEYAIDTQNKNVFQIYKKYTFNGLKTESTCRPDIQSMLHNIHTQIILDFPAIKNCFNHATVHQNAICHKTTFKSALFKARFNLQILKTARKISDPNQVRYQPMDNQDNVFESCSISELQQNAAETKMDEESGEPTDTFRKNQKEKAKKTHAQGGYFRVWLQEVKISIKGNSKQQASRTLAVKELKQTRLAEANPESQYIYQKKIPRELTTLKSIRNKRHLIKYFTDKKIDIETKTPQKVYMQYIKYNLEEYLVYNSYLSLEDRLDLAIQVVQAVNDLHLSGVVHRDIKPENFLVDSDQNGRPLVKIIDLAESVTIDGFDFENTLRDYGCTHPYSPIEASQKKKKDFFNGLTSKEVDYWSVGMVLHFIFYQKIPINYSKPYFADMAIKWRDEMNEASNRRAPIGIFDCVYKVIDLIVARTVRANPEKRMNLFVTSELLKTLKSWCFPM